MKLEDLELITKDKMNLNEYLDFINYVKKNMEHPEWLGDFTIDELKNSDIDLWLYKEKNDIVCSMMSIKASEKSCEKLGIKKNYKEVIDYGQMAVSPKYLGNGLQLQMLKYFDQLFREKRIKYALTTIHPDNNFCIKNMLKDEFDMIGYKEFKRGPRNIYLKKL